MILPFKTKVAASVAARNRFPGISPFDAAGRVRVVAVDGGFAYERHWSKMTDGQMATRYGRLETREDVSP